MAGVKGRAGVVVRLIAACEHQRRHPALVSRRGEMRQCTIWQPSIGMILCAASMRSMQARQLDPQTLCVQRQRGIASLTSPNFHAPAVT
ncbi:hypothetical protein XbrCFBP1976_03850 [Xanthomonas bromi]|uniref:Uncharacterized protein n=1 Tax=Xanthomonas bromi TaxID=56449 RepID=A0ABX5BVQ5_9XANT|nr:hypothetical protein XbrCFBP1976_03850 [Xanthomonas bromi]